MKRGYVKVWRKIQDNDILKNHRYCAFFLWSLTKASHKRINIIVGCQPITLEPGQFVFGRRMAADELGMSEREIRTCLEIAKKADFLTIKTTNKYSIITIINWIIYQGSDDNERPAKRPASDQQATTNKNDKNVKKKTPAEISSQISALKDRYSDQKTIDQVFQAISSTRKLNRIAETVKLSILRTWEKYPVDQVHEAMKIYLEKGYADQGKKESYLLGIIRNNAGKPLPGILSPGEVPGRKVRPSTGDRILDDHYRGQGWEIRT